MLLLGCGSYLRLWLEICRACPVKFFSVSCLLLIIGVGRLGARLPNNDICKRIIVQRETWMSVNFNISIKCQKAIRVPEPPNNG